MKWKRKKVGAKKCKGGTYGKRAEKRKIDWFDRVRMSQKKEHRETKGTALVRQQRGVGAVSRQFGACSEVWRSNMGKHVYAGELRQ